MGAQSPKGTILGGVVRHHTTGEGLYQKADEGGGGGSRTRRRGRRRQTGRKGRNRKGECKRGKSGLGWQTQPFITGAEGTGKLWENKVTGGGDGEGAIKRRVPCLRR